MRRDGSGNVLPPKADDGLSHCERQVLHPVPVMCVDCGRTYLVSNPTTVTAWRCLECRP